MISQGKVDERRITNSFMGSIRQKRTADHRKKLTAAMDRVLALREHEKEIPVMAYLAELDRIEKWLTED